MAQKINPISNRLVFKPNWRSKWFASTKSGYRQYLVDDFKIRDFVNEKLSNASVASVDIHRSKDKLEIKVISSKPGLVIGRGGQGISLLKDQIQGQFYPDGTPVIRLDIIEERKPELSAVLVAQNIGSQIERRIAYRRAAKQALEKTMTAGAKGVKIIVAGRLNGAEIARKEKFQVGSIPLSRFRNTIDYASYPAKTTYGIVGVKVWINQGELEEEE
jgi:small subunit ribosomal protein S3